MLSRKVREKSHCNNVITSTQFGTHTHTHTGTVHTECESIVAKQILGPYSKVLSSNDIDVASLYCATSDIGSMNGHVRIGTLQGSSKIRNAGGDVRVDSAVGELDIVSDDGDVLLQWCIFES